MPSPCGILHGCTRNSDCPTTDWSSTAAFGQRILNGAAVALCVRVGLWANLASVHTLCEAMYEAGERQRATSQAPGPSAS